MRSLLLLLALSLSSAGGATTLPRPALLVIDVQNDFITGSLAVAGAEDIVQPISDLVKDDIWAKVGHDVTQDKDPYCHLCP